MPETDSTLGTAARSLDAHVVQSGVWFYVVGRDGGYVREGDEDSRPVCYSLRGDAQAHADQLNASTPTATDRLLDALHGYQAAGAGVIYSAALVPDGDEDTIADLIAAALAERDGRAAAEGRRA